MKAVSELFTDWRTWEYATVAEVPKWRNVSDQMLHAMFVGVSHSYRVEGHGGYHDDVRIEKERIYIAGIDYDGSPELTVVDRASLKAAWCAVKRTHDQAGRFIEELMELGILHGENPTIEWFAEHYPQMSDLWNHWE